MDTWKLEDESRPVTVTTCNDRKVTHYGPMTVTTEVEAVVGTGLKVTIAQEMPNGEGIVTYAYRRAQSMFVFGT